MHHQLQKFWQEPWAQTTHAACTLVDVDQISLNASGLVQRSTESAQTTHVTACTLAQILTFLCTCRQISISAGNQCTLGRRSEMSSTRQLLVQHYCSYLCPVIQGNVAQQVLHTLALRWLHARKHWQETSKSQGQVHSSLLLEHKPVGEDSFVVFLRRGFQILTNYAH